MFFTLYFEIFEMIMIGLQQTSSSLITLKEIRFFFFCAPNAAKENNLTSLFVFCYRSRFAEYIEEG